MSAKIEVHNLSKKYRIGETFGGFGVRTFRDIFVNKLKNLSLKNNNGVNEIWALKDVTFKVNEGEVLGIIGRNGAGKSTLLKVLSRITRPTEGSILIKGKVASLLEVGTGFNMELTGRENIFLNGSILGMKKKDIEKKFDEIVNFAEVEKFIDTPLKRYSSGMYMRLAFAVAAHIEPDILIVDEVLAVGDFEFQKKCIGKMKDVSKTGKTVLFVSHNMGAVKQLCNKVMVILKGKKEFEGETSAGIDFYFNKHLNNSSIGFANTRENLNRDTHLNIAKIVSIGLKDKQGNYTENISMGDSLQIELEVEFKQNVEQPIFDLIILNSFGQYLSLLRSNWEGLELRNCQGIIKLKIEIPKIHFTPGKYYITPRVTRNINEGFCLDTLHLPLSFNVFNNDITGHGSYINVDPNESYSKYLFHVNSVWEKI